MTKQPFMPLFFGDLLAATAEWEGEARSLYLTLLGHQWSAGSIPTNPDDICRLVGWTPKTFKRYWPRVASKYVEQDGRLYNIRLEEHRQKASSITEKNSGSGKKGARAKWQSTGPHIARHERLSAARAIATHTTAEWEALKHICDSRCVICDSQGDIVKDHITPIYQGGSDGIENLQPLCRRCNSSKGPDRTDYRRNDWLERLSECLQKRLRPPGVNGRHQTPGADACLHTKQEKRTCQGEDTEHD